MEPLREFLVDSLAEEPIDLDPGEVIVDAVVVFRVASVDEGSRNGVGERYRYTVTGGVTLSSALGMLRLAEATMTDYYTRLLNDEDDEDGD